MTRSLPKLEISCFLFFNLEMAPALRVGPTGDPPLGSSGSLWIFRASEFGAFPKRLDFFNLSGIFTFWQGALVPTDLPPGLSPLDADLRLHCSG